MPMTSATDSGSASPNGRFSLPLPRNLAIFLLVLLGLFVLMNYSSIALLIDKWKTDDNYSHGFLIPFISLYFVWSKKEELARLKPRPVTAALPILLMGMAMWFVGTGTKSVVGGGLAIVVMVSALVLYLGGWSIYRVLWLPTAYLLFMVPLPGVIYDKVALPLQQFASYASSLILKGVFSVPLIRNGNVLQLFGHTLQVEEACSGIRSIMGLLALSVAFSYFWERPLWERLLLIASSVPIALVANISRVVVTALLYHGGYAKFAQGFYHEFTGWFVFIFAMGLFLLEAYLLSKLFVYDHPSDEKKSGPSAEAGKVEPDDPETPEVPNDPDEAVATAPKPSVGTFRLHRHFYVAAVLLAIPAVSWPWALGMKTVEPVPLKEELATIPHRLGDWTGQDVQMKETVRYKTGADQILQRNYVRRKENPIGIYIAYWGGLQGRAPHRPSACRPGAGWKLVSRKEKDYGLEGFANAARVNEEVYSLEGRTDVVVWWEYLQGKNVSSQWMQRMLMLLPGWLGGKKGSVLQVQVTTTLGEDEVPEQGLVRIQKFMDVLGPHLKRVLPVGQGPQNSRAGEQ